MSNLIEEYGLIGDGETAALVHRDGSIACLGSIPMPASPRCWEQRRTVAGSSHRSSPPVHPAAILKTPLCSRPSLKPALEPFV
jgi:hypothetical protein